MSDVWKYHTFKVIKKKIWYVNVSSHFADIIQQINMFLSFYSSHFFGDKQPFVRRPTFHSCCSLLLTHCFSFPPSAIFSQVQRLSYLKAEPPCVLSWLSSCLKGDTVPPFPYLPGICQRTRLLVLVTVKFIFEICCITSFSCLVQLVLANVRYAFNSITIWLSSFNLSGI